MTTPDHGQESTAEQAKHAALDVAGTAREQAGAVAAETRRQAARVTDDVRRQLGEQADRRRGEAAQLLRTTGDELGSMADGQSQLTQQLVRMSSDQLRGLAEYVENHGPEELLADVRRFARRRPGAFLLMAGLAGVVAGRMVRGTAAARSTADSGAGSTVRPLAAPAADVSSTEDTLVYSTTTPGAPAGDIDITDPAYAAVGTDWERRHG
jgi:hypothetical protein